MPDGEASRPTDPRRLAARIVAAYARRNHLDANAVASLIVDVRSTLAQLGTAPMPERIPAVSVRRSVTRDYVVCLECGWKGRLLRRHLMASHGLARATYRERWQLPREHPLIAPGYSERRSALAKQIGLGRGRAAAATPAGTEDRSAGPAARKRRAGGNKKPPRRARQQGGE